MKKRIIRTNNSNRVDEHDMTRKMLSTIRRVTIFENEPQVEPTTAVGENEPQDTVTPSQQEIDEEYSQFTETLNTRADFTTYKIYPEAGNVVLGGKIKNGIEFQFTLEDINGLYITTNNLQVDDNVLTILQKLKGYYDNWASKWEEKLRTDYKNNEEL